MKLTRRGKIVLALVIVAGLVGEFWLVDHVNWVGDHYCFQDSITCYFGKK
jgi:hypothetical protein